MHSIWERVFKTKEQGLLECPEDDPSRFKDLTSLADMLVEKFQLTSDVALLDKSITLFEEAKDSNDLGQNEQSILLQRISNTMAKRVKSGTVTVRIKSKEFPDQPCLLCSSPA